MARLRKKDRQEVEDVDVPAPEAPGVRDQGPWDSTEKSGTEEQGYIDLGSLLVRGDEGYALQLPADNEDGEIGSVMLVADDSALELRAFAATRSGGLWDEVRADILEEVARLDGECTETEGPFGTELQVTMPATMPDGESGVQPSLILGVEGPRWMLRATFLGQAALFPADHPLMSALRNVIVVRGSEPRIQREPLLLTIPPNAIAAPLED
ncbi:DUF3710 domain-containing protein [Aeromicrobium sp.]|uniref:DUF3710 domain-containing protein n=1 Tax=Aeromicrobium sp. TaxID=1871063 RepID=UPI002FCC325B